MTWRINLIKSLVVDKYGWFNSFQRSHGLQVHRGDILSAPVLEYVIRTNEKIHQLKIVNKEHRYLTFHIVISIFNIASQPMACLFLATPLQWSHNEHDGVPNHQPQHC